jgi:DUF1009 family protein
MARLGMIAGNGRFPILALETARTLGQDVVVIALKKKPPRKSNGWRCAVTGSRSAN